MTVNVERVQVGGGALCGDANTCQVIVILV